MANEMLAKQMMKCDGTNKNCEGCMFRDHPGCRNAMAHHGGALIQLQDMVIENLAQTINGLKGSLAKKTADHQTVTQIAERACYQANALEDHLRARKDCKTCNYDCMGQGTPEVCDKCRGAESQWELCYKFKLEHRMDPPEDEEDEADEDDEEGVIELS